MLLALACGFLAGNGCRKAADETPAVSVQVEAVHPSMGSISEEIAADAILAPLAQAALVPRLTAPIRALYVQRGARVHRGQILVALEAADLHGTALDSEGGLQQAKAAYDTATRATIPEEMQRAQLEVNQAKANLELANRTAGERKRLLEQGAIAGRDVDTAIAAAVQAQAAYDIAVKHLESARQTTSQAAKQTAQGQLISAQGRLENASAQVGYATLRSPINGVVTDQPYFKGETAPAGSAVVTVMDTSSLLAKVHLAQASAQELSLGKEAEITVPGATDPVRATVSLISPALDPGSTTVEVWLKLPNTAGMLKVGTPVHVVITGRTQENAIQVPVSALLPSLDGGNSVMVVGADGAAHKRSVKTGIRTPETIEITKGLTTADNVITEGSYGIDDGTKVTMSGGKPTAEDKE